MRQKSKVVIFLITLIISFNFRFFFIDIDENKSEPKNQLQNSDFWILNISQIFIDDNNPMHNWEMTAATWEWCSGSGIWADPYLIENVTIDGLNKDNSIEIRNSNVYFIIRNCTIYNSNPNGYDIYLENTNNSKLIENNCSNSGGYAIYLEHSHNNTLSGNIENSNSIGICLVFSDNNTLLGNTLNNNELYGILLSFSNNNTLSGNIVSNNDHGIDILYISINNTVSGNIINNNSIGIYGLIMDDNIFYENSIQNSEDYGIYFYGGTQNLFFQNYFINNSIHAYDEGYDNYWNNLVIGNYWDNYTGVDANDDGIGDTPHDILPLGGSVDNFPIWNDGDDVAPNIVINLPIMNDMFGFTAPEFNISIDDESSINTMWYTLDGGVSNYWFTGLTGCINETAWEQEEDGVITIRFYANDSLGHLGFKDVNINKDTVVPEIVIISPHFNDIFGSDAPEFELVITESYLFSTWYTLDGGLTNYTFYGRVSRILPDAWDDAREGEVIITFYVQDIIGNTASASVTVIKRLPPGSAIPGYNMYLAYGFAFIVLLLTLKEKHRFKRRRK